MTNNKFKNILNDEGKIWIKNIFLSLVIHGLLIGGIAFIYESSGSAKINPEYFSIETRELEKKSDLANDNNLDLEKDENKSNAKDDEIKKVTSDGLTLSDIKADTTNLDQVYKESTLNLSIKYPRGWAFIDQNRNKKLDGVTFWAAESNNNPPPYIHLEVVEKYLFNEKRYKYKLELDDCVAFYNDPEELSGQVAQVFYLRTDSDEDYQIKLIINGMKEFNSFQPKFLAILNSFHFGGSLF